VKILIVWLSRPGCSPAAIDRQTHPVKKDACSEHKNNTAWALSRTDPERFIGLDPAMDTFGGW
jgi:hypothetical protein